MVRVFLIFIFSLSVFYSKAQGFRTRHYTPQAANNSTRSIFEVSPGNYLGTGFATDTSTGFSRSSITIMGLDAQGQIQWLKKHHGGSIEYINNPFAPRCFYKKDSSLYFIGCAHDSDGGNGRMFGVFIKYNLNGDTLWRKTYRSSDSLEDVVPQMVTGSIDGGYLMTGFFQHWGNNTRPCLLIKTDANGNELWRKHINKSGHNVSDGRAIVQDSISKKVVIVGYQYIGTSAAASTFDHVLILDSLGNKLFQSSYIGFSGNGAYDVIQTKDSNFVIVGSSSYQFMPQLFPMQRSFAVKFSLSNPGLPLWKIVQTDLISKYDVFVGVKELKNNTLLVGNAIDTLYGNFPNAYYSSGTITRFVILDKNGQILKKRYYDYYPSPDQERDYHTLTSFNLCSDGGWVAAIGSYDFPKTNPFFFVRYDSTGCDTTVKYCKMLAEVGVSEVQLLDFTLRIYPNPFSDQINFKVISAQNLVASFQYNITDITGRTIKAGSIQEFTGSQQIEVNTISPGIYLFNATIEGRKYSVKLFKQ